MTGVLTSGWLAFDGDKLKKKLASYNQLLKVYEPTF